MTLTAERGLNSATVPDSPLLRVRDLVKHFETGSLLAGTRRVRAVDGVSFDIARGETLGLVGESGCGKSTVARCILRLVDPTAGSVEFEGTDLAALPRTEMQKLRRRIQIVFQDPNGSLNPRMLVRSTVAEPLRIHLDLTESALDARLIELMGLVGLDRSYLNRYPHQLSGGQRQRVGIARAIATDPSLIVLDEPTSCLDVSVQGQILLLLQELQRALGLSYLFISHDLSVIKHVCQRVAVMYLGHVVEMGATSDVFERPQHPYTKALLSSIPSAALHRRRERVRLGGEIPSSIDIPAGCRLSPRCPYARADCFAAEPPLIPVAGSHQVACYAATGWPSGDPVSLT